MPSTPDNPFIRFLNFLPDTGSVVALRELYKVIGPEMPVNLSSTRVDSDIPGAEVLKFNYDEGHAGRFSVPGTDGGSLGLDWVNSQPSVGPFINSKLALGTTAVTPGKVETPIFSPGLNTVHEHTIPGESTTVDRLKYYIRVLGDANMAQIHTGTSMDQGNARISLKGAPLLSIIMRLVRFFAPEEVKPELDGDDVVWPARNIDAMQVALSKFGLIDTPIKKSFRGVLNKTKTDDEFCVALLVYSRASVEVMAGLKMHIKESRNAGETQQHIEKRLRERVTVVTIGPATTGFPDGPKYIHLSSWNDPLAKREGVNGQKTSGAGRDAVFLNCGTPYNQTCFDNHNFGALTSQFLRLVLATSGASDFAHLWEMMHKGHKVVPDNVDLLTNAMIRLTRGYDWIWNTETAFEGIDLDEQLPTEQEAVTILRDSMGDAFVNSVLKTFPPQGSD